MLIINWFLRCWFFNITHYSHAEFEFFFINCSFLYKKMGENVPFLTIFNSIA